MEHFWFGPSVALTGTGGGVEWSGASPFPQLPAGENENEIAALKQQVH